MLFTELRIKKKFNLHVKVRKYRSILPIEMKFVDFMKNLKANRCIKREIARKTSSYFKDNRILFFRSWVKDLPLSFGYIQIWPKQIGVDWNAYQTGRKATEAWIWNKRNTSKRVTPHTEFIWVKIIRSEIENHCEILF